MFRIINTALVIALTIIMVPHTVTAQDQPLMGAWETCPAPQNLAGEIPFGLNMGLTGPTSLYGIPQQQGSQLAIDIINESGYLGDATLVDILEDGGSTPEEAIAAMDKLVNEDNVVGIIGPTFSTQAFAADPIAQEAGIPVMGVSNLATGITDMGEFVFRNGLLDNIQIPAAVNALIDVADIERVAVIYQDDNEFTVTGFDVFVETLDANDIEITDEETFQTGDIDFNAQITNIIASDPDAVMVSALAAEAVPFLEQLRNFGYTKPIVGGNGLNAPSLVSEANAEGAIIGAAWHISNDNPINLEFVERFEAEFGFQPDQFAAQAYTAAWLFATAMRCGDSANPADIRDELATIREFDSPLGAFSFDENRDPVHEATVQIIIDGAFEVLTPDTFSQIYP